MPLQVQCRSRAPAAAAAGWSGALHRKAPQLGILVLAAAVVLAYGNSMHGPFVLDDLPSIPGNPTLRHLGRIADVLSPPAGGGLTVEGRPVLNLSLAVNYAVGGLRPWSYHAVNVLVHLGAALALFGVVRRTAAGRDATALALAAALAWAVHPLATESVTYVVQRAESLMGLFYLLTVYCFIRAAEERSTGAPHGRDARAPLLWLVLSWLACLLGMATKEVMVSAPVVVLLLDRFRFAGSFARALRGRKAYYTALAATWILLAALVLRAGDRGGTSAFGSGVSVWRYWATQPAAIIRYLKLCFWPRPLVFDYGTEWVSRPSQVIGPGLLVAALAAAAALGCARNRGWGVLGFCFFAVLAPTSLVPGNRQTAAEHRMYLALAAVLVLAALALRAILDAALKRGWRGPGPAADRARWAGLSTLGVAAGLSVPALLATRARNQAYSSAVGLYASDAAQMPGNAYAQANEGTALLLAGRPAEARAPLEAALRLNPGLSEAEDTLGNALVRLGEDAAAERHYRRAAAIDPGFAEPHGNLGELLLKQGRLPEARAEAERALALKPRYADAHGVLGMVAMSGGDLGGALSEFAEAERLAPDDADAHVNLGNALRAAGAPEQAAEHYARAAALDPGSVRAQYDWAGALSDRGLYPDAERHLRAAAALDPADSSVRQNLGNALLAEGRLAEAVEQYKLAERLAPERAPVHYNLANGLLRLGRREEAVLELQLALRLDPDLAPARRMLRALGAPGP